MMEPKAAIRRTAGRAVRRAARAPGVAHIHTAARGVGGYARSTARGGRAFPWPLVVRALADRWYHDFAPLGFPTPQHGAPRARNQASKQPILFDLIRRAVHPGDRVVELFCADGFFAIYAAQLGAHVTGIDRDDVELRHARAAAKALCLPVRFEARDVFDVNDQWDVALIPGGLYHLEDPERLLATVQAKRLVVQTVVYQDDPDYFETPAPGWTWGCRFSPAYLAGMLERTGWRVIDQQVGQLAGNRRPEDIMSAYVLAER